MIAAFGPLARFYRDHFESLRGAFDERYQRDLVSAFRRLQDAGHLEIITCGATHGFLPLMQQTPGGGARADHRGREPLPATFGRDAPGIWLAECGYYPGRGALPGGRAHPLLLRGHPRR